MATVVDYPPVQHCFLQRCFTRDTGSPENNLPHPQAAISSDLGHMCSARKTGQPTFQWELPILHLHHWRSMLCEWTKDARLPWCLLWAPPTVGAGCCRESLHHKPAMLPARYKQLLVCCHGPIPTKPDLKKKSNKGPACTPGISSLHHRLIYEL